MSDNLRKKIIVFLDNASSNDTTTKEMKALFSSRTSNIWSNFFHMRCAHILNLIVEDGLNEVAKSIEKVRECVKYIKI